MGTSNRERRRRKKEKRVRAERARRPAQVPYDDLARAAVYAAAEEFLLGRRSEYAQRLLALASLAERGGGAAVDRALGWCTDRGLERAWTCGWQPADVLRAVGRRRSPAHAAVLAPRVWASARERPEMRTHGRWAAQVEALTGEAGVHALQPDLALGVEALSVLLELPPLPRLSSTSPASSRTDGRHGAILERVRALLAKAESTTFPQEAEALTAKAHELMARHAIDQAMLEAGGDGGAVIVGWRIGIDDPYASAKSLLLDRIAGASGCRAVWSKQLGFATVFGVPSDLEMVELLFTSLLVQATDAMMRAGREANRSGPSRTRSFRQSFLIAYANRIGERMSQTTARIVAEGAERHGDRLLPVLARRDEAVDAAVRIAYPQLRYRSTAISNYSGWLAGRAAAEVASLSVGQELAAG